MKETHIKKEEHMDLRLTFNSNPENYDGYRPLYPESLYRDLIQYSKLDHSKRALEIGIGTGQATRPILNTACNLTAVEIGDQLAAFTKHKFSDYKNLQVINGDFESVELESNFYNLIYSASAFHWIPLDTGLEKVMNLLQKDGVFAWFSIQPAPAPEHYHIHERLQMVYKGYSEYFQDYKIEQEPDLIKRKIKNALEFRVEAFKTYGFGDIQSKTYTGNRSLKAVDYGKLISTFSDHIAMPENKRIPFLNEVVKTIENHGGIFNLSDTIILCMGRK